ncbi:hypothetical protein [Bifidobacterium imperatoris]|nr:hypothetical protein [Bifidobacterium imperatoris]
MSQCLTVLPATLQWIQGLRRKGVRFVTQSLKSITKTEIAW